MSKRSPLLDLEYKIVKYSLNKYFKSDNNLSLDEYIKYIVDCSINSGQDGTLFSVYTTLSVPISKQYSDKLVRIEYDIIGDSGACYAETIIWVADSRISLCETVVYEGDCSSVKDYEIHSENVVER